MFGNKVLQTVTNLGTGTYQLNTTATGGWRTWRAAFTSGATVAYFAENEDSTVWEFGFGTLTHGSPDTITRTLRLSSSGSLIDWTPADGTIYVMSVPWSEATDGRWDATAAMFVAAGRRPFTAAGATNKTVTAADAAGRFSLDNSAAARTVTLPAISAVSVGFNVEVYGLSSANFLNITPSGTDAIDGGAGGATLAVQGDSVVSIVSTGSAWRTNYRLQLTTATQSAANNSTRMASTAYADRVGVQQVVPSYSGSVATGTTLIPFDDTVPQNTEGDQYLAASITPRSATSQLLIEIRLCASPSVTSGIIVALFKDSDASALAVSYDFVSTAFGRTTLVLTFWQVSGSTAARTYKVRAGLDAAGTLTVNGSNGARIFGGVLYSSLTITEIGI